MNRHLIVQRLKEFCQRRWQTKVLSLVFAIIVFYAIRSIISAQHTFTVPVIPRSLPGAGVTVIAAEPSEVQVTLRGSHAQLNAIRPESLRVEAYTRRTPSQTGTSRARLRLIRPDNDFNVRVLEISPARATLTYDAIGDVTMDVAPPELIGQPLSGVAEVEWVHTQVTVRGSMTRLTELKKRNFALQTEPVTVSGTTRDFVKRVRILLPKDIGQAQTTPEEIEVRVRNTLK